MIMSNLPPLNSPFPGVVNSNSFSRTFKWTNDKLLLLLLWFHFHVLRIFRHVATSSGCIGNNKRLSSCRVSMWPAEFAAAPQIYFLRFARSWQPTGARSEGRRYLFRPFSSVKRKKSPREKPSSGSCMLQPLHQ